MRLIRVAAFTAWAAIASLAVAGFAVFSPGGPPGEVEDVSTTVIIRSDWGSLTGRIAAMALATGARAPSDEAPPTPTEDEALMTLSQPTPQAISTTSTTATVVTTTTPAAPTTTRPKPPPTTTPPTTTPPTTTAPPATTTTTRPPPDTTTTTAPPHTFPAAIEQWRGLVQQYFLAGDVNVALHVIECESGGDANATNSHNGAAGLFQHLPKYWEARSAAAGFEGASIYDPVANIGTAAWLVYQGGGWGHWSSCLP